MPQEMLACGLPCVDLDRPEHALGVRRRRAGRRWRTSTRDAIADALERLLDDEDEWERRSRLGLEFVRDHTWDAAAEQVERELRNALRVREELSRPPAPLGALLAVSALLAVTWACVLPAFQAPDEQSHFTYVQSLAERHALPGRRRPPVLLDADDAGHRGA